MQPKSSEYDVTHKKTQKPRYQNNYRDNKHKQPTKATTQYKTKQQQILQNDEE